jgi:hypothetical protein
MLIFYPTFPSLRRCMSLPVWSSLHYPHLGQVIRAISDVLIITGIFPNGAMASHLSTNSTDSVAPLSINSTENPTAGVKISHINDNDASENKQPISLPSIQEDPIYLATQYFEVMV